MVPCDTFRRSSGNRLRGSCKEEHCRTYPRTIVASARAGRRGPGRDGTVEYGRRDATRPQALVATQRRRPARRVHRDRPDPVGRTPQRPIRVTRRTRSRSSTRSPGPGTRARSSERASRRVTTFATSWPVGASDSPRSTWPFRPRPMDRAPMRWRWRSSDSGSCTRPAAMSCARHSTARTIGTQWSGVPCRPALPCSRRMAGRHSSICSTPSPMRPPRSGTRPSSIRTPRPTSRPRSRSIA